jgi:putative glycosyltransferase
MTARYVRALLLHEEREVFIGGIWAITGFRQEPMTITKGFRSGTSYTLRRRAALMVSAVTSFSSKPLVMIFHLGLLISFLSLCAALLLIVRVLFFRGLLIGWPSLIVSIWMLGGLTIFSLGVIGIYVSRVFEEVKQRPYTIVRDVHEHPGSLQ